MWVGVCARVYVYLCMFICMCICECAPLCMCVWLLLTNKYGFKLWKKNFFLSPLFSSEACPWLWVVHRTNTAKNSISGPLAKQSLLSRLSRTTTQGARCEYGLHSMFLPTPYAGFHWTWSKNNSKGNKYIFSPSSWSIQQPSNKWRCLPKQLTLVCFSAPSQNRTRFIFFCIFILRRGRGSSFSLQVWTLRGWARWAQRVRGKLDPSIKRPPSTIFLPRHSARLSWVRSRSGRLAGVMCGIHPFKQSWRAAPAGPSFVVLRRGLWYPVITAVSSRMRVTVKWKVRGWMKKCF